MAEVKFTDNSAEVKAKFTQAINSFLYEMGGEIQGQAVRNSRVDSGKLRGSWDYVVNPGNQTVTIGSNEENALYEEFGTGDYAIGGDGRNGGWWIKVGTGKGEISPRTVNKYGWEKVQKDEAGNITYVFTRGKRPNRTLGNAVNMKKKTIKRRFEAIMRGGK